MRTYCIKVWRECEEIYVFHFYLDSKPTREQIIDAIVEEDIGYDDVYGKFEYWQVG